MKRTPAKRSSLFLLELIIAILFFSLTSAVCVQIFVRAHLISRQTQEENMALEKIFGFTEVFLTGTSLADLPGVTATESSDSNTDSDTVSMTSDTNAQTTEDYLIYYDSDWQTCSVSDASYLIRIQITPQGALQHGTFAAERLTAANQEDTVIYSVETDYCPEPEKEAIH